MSALRFWSKHGCWRGLPRTLFSLMPSHHASLPIQAEFYFSAPENFILVQNLREGVVRILATHDCFSGRRKASFVRELAAEGFIPEEFAYVEADSADEGLSGPLAYKVKWVLEPTWQRVPENVTRQSHRRCCALYALCLAVWALSMHVWVVQPTEAAALTQAARTVRSYRTNPPQRSGRQPQRSITAWRYRVSAGIGRYPLP